MNKQTAIVFLKKYRGVFLAIGIILLFVVLLSGNARAVHTQADQRACAQITVENAIVGGSTRVFTTIMGGSGNGLPTVDRCEEFVSDANDFRAQVSADDNEFVFNFRHMITGVAPPEAPQIVRIRLLQDDTANIECTVDSVGFPAFLVPGDVQFSLTATDNCAGVTPVAGTWRGRIDIIRNDIVDANDYDCNSDGREIVGANRDCADFIASILQSGMTVSTITAPAPPSGSTYAFGVAAAETVTVTTTHELALANIAVWDVRIDSYHSDGVMNAPLYELGANQDVGIGATNTQIFTIDDTYGDTDFTTTILGASFLISGNSVLDPALGWTFFQLFGQGAQIIVLGDLAVDDVNLANANGHVRIDSDGALPFDSNVETNHEVYNRVEAVTCDYFVLNARGQQVTRSANVQIINSGGGTESSQTRTGTNYLCSYSTTAAHTATADTLGSPKDIRWSTGGSEHSSIDQFGISSLYFLDAHVENDALLDKDDFPTENANEDFTYISGESIVNLWCHVVGVRKDVNIDTSGNSGGREIRDSAGTVRDSGTYDTGPDGWVNSEMGVAAAAPTGIWEAECNVSFNGNSGQDIQSFTVISAFTGDKVIRLAFETPTEETTIRIWVLIELQNAPFEPDSVPTIRIGGVINGNLFWSELIDPAANLTNAANFTESVNGSLYFYDFVTVIGSWSVVVEASFNGTGIHETQTLEVLSMENEMLITFETFAPLILFAILVAWAEWTRNIFIYIIAIIAGATAVMLLPDSLAALRFILAAVVFLVGMRAIATSIDAKEERDNAN